MENTFGIFLKQKRQEKNLTQKELARLLIVSESAVSKWEKDVAHPDISLLPKISQILGVTEHELITASIDEQSKEERSQAKKWRIFSFSWSLFFYIAYAIALISCFICNLAINKTLSWFWIVVCALILAFTFTNLPKLVKKHKLILLPTYMFLALSLLLAACNIYTNNNWFWIAFLSILLGLIIIFMPIFISKYKIFCKIKKYNDFVSIFIDFVVLNIFLIIIDCYTLSNGYTSNYWYLTTALPIVVVIYLILNLFLSIRFLKVNKLFKTSIILFFINILYFISSIITVTPPYIQKELNSLKFYKANFLNWQTEICLERNIHCIIFLTILFLAILFLIIGLILHIKRKNKPKIN